LGTSRRRGIFNFLVTVQLNRALARSRSFIGMTTYMPWVETQAALMRLDEPARKNLSFGTLGAVLGARLLTIFNALQVERASNDVVANTGQILDTTAAHQNDRVLLQVVAFTADIRNDFEAVGQTNLGDFTQGGVWLLGGSGVHTSANTTALGAVFERRALAASAADFARLAHELTNGWHNLYASCECYTPWQVGVMNVLTIDMYQIRLGVY